MPPKPTSQKNPHMYLICTPCQMGTYYKMRRQLRFLFSVRHVAKVRRGFCLVSPRRMVGIVSLYLCFVMLMGIVDGVRPQVVVVCRHYGKMRAQAIGFLAVGTT